MTKAEHLTNNIDTKPFVEGRKNLTLGVDKKREWLSAPQRCIGEVRTQRTKLADDFRILISLGYGHRNESEAPASLDNTYNPHYSVACCRVLNFVISCNRLAQEKRLVISLDAHYYPDIGKEQNEQYRQLLIGYEASSNSKNLLVHSSFYDTSGQLITSNEHLTQGFKPDDAELIGDEIIFTKNYQTSSSMHVTEKLHVGPAEIPLLDFFDTASRDQHSLTDQSNF